ncbi:MAG: YfhO family protein [Porcipelethomonas sp.]
MGNKKQAKKTDGKQKPVYQPFWKNKNNILLYNRNGETRVYLFLAFIIPFLIMWIMFRKFEVHPFGDKQILVTDLWHQYFPFFRELQDKLQHFSSLLFSWNTGMGTNFVSLLSYYGASPLNILAVLFPLENSRDAITLLLTIKIGCAGLFCAIFLKNVFKRNDFSITGFALFYALCDYIMGYYWNVIWIDTVALLPLVVLGTIKLFKEGKFKLYAVSLALSLVSNFYIGLFTCIFTVMVFAACVISEWEGIRHALRRLAQIAGATVIGIGLGAVVLLPAFLALQLTNSANNTFPAMIEYYEKWTAMISNVIGFHEPTAKEGLPNFYCGMFAVILLGVYIRAKEIKIREKVITVIYLAFIIVSCNMNVLNYMWHGFHFTNMLPYRFAFLFSFILIASAYRAFTVMSKNIKSFDIIAMLVMTFTVLLVSYNEQPEKAVVSSFVVCMCYILIMFLYERKLIKKSALNFLVFAVCTAEMTFNAYYGVEKVTVTDYVSYPKNYEDVSALIDVAEDRDKSFYRTELMTNYTINDPPLYGFRGVSQFSSTANVNVTNLLQKLGIQASAAGNRYYYTQSTPVVNMFLNIKYLISHDGYSGDLTYLEPLAESGRSTLFENACYLPVGFVADPSLIDYDGSSVNQFRNQEELFRKATGIEESVYNEIEVRDVGHQGVNVTKDSYGSYRYQIDNSYPEENTRYFKYNYIIPDDGPVYVSFEFDNVSTLKIRQEDTEIKSFSLGKYVNTFPVGDFKSGDVVTLYAEMSEENNGMGKVYVYQVNDEVLQKGYEKLSAGALSVTDYSDTRINGTVEAAEDGFLYTSIPHDGGWKVFVDGKETEVTPLKNALVCVPVSAGSHTVEMKYTPPGFTAGLVITFVSLGLFAACAFLEKKISVKKNRDGSEEADGENEKS